MVSEVTKCTVYKECDWKVDWWRTVEFAQRDLADVFGRELEVDWLLRRRMYVWLPEGNTVSFTVFVQKNPLEWPKAVAKPYATKKGGVGEQKWAFTSKKKNILIFSKLEVFKCPHLNIHIQASGGHESPSWVEPLAQYFRLEILEIRKFELCWLFNFQNVRFSKYQSYSRGNIVFARRYIFDYVMACLLSQATVITNTVKDSYLVIVFLIPSPFTQKRNLLLFVEAFSISFLRKI